LKSIKWGIIGLGKIAHKFATDIATVPNCELYAVASRTQQKADDFAQKHNAKNAYDTYEKLVSDINVDAVYIATPHSLHFDNTLLCLQHKKAVLCEKPFAMNAEQVNQMIAVAKENNVLLMEALWTRFLPHFQYVLDIVESKKYGELKNLKADFGFYTPYNTESRVFQKRVGGGSLLDIGIYPIFAALTSLGKPHNIKSEATFFENGADSSCSMMFNYDNAKAELQSTFLEETKTEAIYTFENAIVKINTRFHEPSSVTVIENGKEETIDFNYKTIGYSYEIDHFNELLRKEKTESPLMTFELSKTLIEILDEVRSKIGLTY